MAFSSRGRATCSGLYASPGDRAETELPWLPGCQTSIGNDLDFVGDVCVGASWVRVQFSTVPPPTARSANFIYPWITSDVTQPGRRADFDAVYLGASARIFDHDFETGEICPFTAFGD
jgi:hypothetical protein